MPLHVTLHAHPGRSFPSQEMMLQGGPRQVLVIPAGELSRPLPVRFDDVLTQLEQLPRLFIEPDGSFIWIGPRGPQQWKLDGQLHDSASGLMTVELKISGTDPALDDVLRTLGWPAAPVVFELVREGVYLDEANFRAVLAVGLP